MVMITHRGGGQVAKGVYQRVGYAHHMVSTPECVYKKFSFKCAWQDESGSDWISSCVKQYFVTTLSITTHMVEGSHLSWSWNGHLEDWIPLSKSKNFLGVGIFRIDLPCGPDLPLWNFVQVKIGKVKWQDICSVYSWDHSSLGSSAVSQAQQLLASSKEAYLPPCGKWWLDRSSSDSLCSMVLTVQKQYGAMIIIFWN